MLGGNVDVNIEGSPLREKLFFSECITKAGSTAIRSNGDVGSSVGSSVGIEYMESWRVFHIEWNHLLYMVGL